MAATDGWWNPNHPVVRVDANASGAARAGRRGDVVLIVDVIDMSTSLESVLEAGAAAVYGASPDQTAAPVFVRPERLGCLAGRQAVAQGVGVWVVGEPRAGTDQERWQRITRVAAGLREAGATLLGVVPSLGAETARLADFRNQVVIAVTDTEGVAYDAAWQAGGRVVVGTVARTLRKKGPATAELAAQRALTLAGKEGRNITVVAASANALEDVLAAEFIANLICTTRDLSSININQAIYPCQFAPALER